MKCILLGGGGFLGSAIADRLLSAGHSVRIFERPRVNPYRTFLVSEPVEWISGDLLSTYDVAQAIEGVDIVFHLISTTLPKSSNDNPIYDVQSNLVGTLQILSTMVTQKVPKIIFISSGGTVYGTPVYLPIDEKHPTEPQVSYGIIKLAIEKYLLMYERLYGIKAIVLRVANPYGERQRIETAQGAVGVFLHRALNGLPIDIWGDGSVTRDYLHVSDVAEAFVKAADYSGSCSIFNISSGTGVCLNTLVDKIEEALGMPINRHYLPGRPFDVPVSVLSNRLASQELSWNPQVDLATGLLRTAAWMKGSSTDLGCCRMNPCAVSPDEDTFNHTSIFS